MLLIPFHLWASVIQKKKKKKRHPRVKRRACSLLHQVLVFHQWLKSKVCVPNQVGSTHTHYHSKPAVLLHVFEPSFCSYSWVLCPCATCVHSFCCLIKLSVQGLPAVDTNTSYCSCSSTILLLFCMETHMQ